MMTPFLLAIDINKIINKVCFVFAAFVLINIALIPILGIPDFGYRGICPQKNLLGQISCVSLFFCFFQALKEKGYVKSIFYIVSILSFFLILISKSKTTLALSIPVPFIASIAIYLISFKNPFGRLSLGFFIATLAMIFGAIFLLFEITIYELIEFLFNNSTFTGRTIIWEFVGYNISKEPYIGYGYGSFWGVKTVGFNFIRFILQAHNGYLDILLELGFIGLILTIIYIYSLIKCIFSYSKSDKALSILLISCLIFVLFIFNIMVTLPVLLQRFRHH
jgi:O-antigen ligase